MICTECNSTIENDCKYCTNCGVKVIVVSESKSGANWFFLDCSINSYKFISNCFL